MVPNLTHDLLYRTHLHPRRYPQTGYSADQPRHAGSANGLGTTHLSQRILVRQARNRNTALGVVAAFESCHPQHAPEKIRREIRANLDPRRFATLGPHAKTSQVITRLSGRAHTHAHGSGLRHALWHTKCRKRTHQTQRTRLRPYLGHPALPAVRGQFHRQRAGCRLRCAGENAQPPRPARGQALPRRPRLHRRTSAKCQRLLDAKRTAGSIGHELPRRTEVFLGQRRPLPLRMPKDRPLARRAIGLTAGAIQTHLPIALRPRRMAQALHPSHTRRPG